MFDKITNSLALPILFVIVSIAVQNVICLLKSTWNRKGKSYIFRRRNYRFWRFLPHLIYFCAIFTFTLSHHNYPDLLLLLVTCPMIFWCFALLLRQPLQMDHFRRVEFASDWWREFFNRHVTGAVMLSTAFYLYPVISLYRNVILFIG